jgi:pimeloyl-ACP methyl ester carboxylesterase
MGEAGKIVTLIIHGTYAKKSDWWKVSADNRETFGNGLEKALGHRGMPGTVWRPVLKSGMTYDDFTWEGNNRHHDRVRGAKKLCKSLDKLSESLNGSSQNPLEVNFVAHSHGGNVVLEALRKLPKSIKVRRVIFMGTPLVTLRPAFRLLRLFLSYGLLVLANVLFLLGITSLSIYFLPIGPIGFLGPKAGLSFILFSAAFLMFYTVIVWVMAINGDVLWYLPGKILMGLRGYFKGQAYGPPSRKLAQVLEGRKIVLLTSHGDEADIILSLSTSPRELYLAYAGGIRSSFLRIVERILLRPVCLDLFIRATAVILERLGLGIPLPRLMFYDYEMASLDSGKAYPPEIIERRDVTSYVQNVVQDVLEKEAPYSFFSPSDGDAKGLTRHARNMKDALDLVFRNLISQVNLQHSAYYQCPEVVKTVADALQ